MNDNSNDIVIGEEPILQFGLHYDEADELTKTYLIAQGDVEEVEQSALSADSDAVGHLFQSVSDTVPILADGFRSEATL